MDYFFQRLSVEMFRKLLFSMSILCLCQTSSANDGWKNKKAEIYFLFDSSNSVYIVDYRKMCDFVSSVVGDMDIGPDKTRVGVGIFADDHQMYLPLDKYSTKPELQKAIENAPRPHGDTYISRALNGMRQEGFSLSITRPDVPRIGVLFTDGKSRQGQLTHDNATMAKKEGIFIFTIGIGNQVDPSELRTIASEPKRVFYHQINNYRELTDLKHTLSHEMSQVEVLKQGDKSACSTSQVDTVFVYDEVAMGKRDSTQVRSFIENLVNNMDMDSGNMRVGVVSKTCLSGDILLEQYLKTSDFKKALAGQGNKQPGIIELIEKARTDSFMPESGGRVDAKQRIVLIMDADLSNSGASKSQLKKKYGRSLVMQGRRAQNSGIEVYVIAVGTNYNKKYLNLLATSDKHVIYFETVKDFADNDKRTSFLHKFCKDL